MSAIAANGSSRVDVDDVRGAEFGGKFEARLVAVDGDDARRGRVAGGHDRGEPDGADAEHDHARSPVLGRAVLNTAPAPVETPQASGPISSSGNLGRTATRARGVVNA